MDEVLGADIHLYKQRLLPVRPLLDDVGLHKGLEWYTLGEVVRLVPQHFCYGECNACSTNVQLLAAHSAKEKVKNDDL